jgi:PPOX class probable FMN-dependent enzyme
MDRMDEPTAGTEVDGEASLRSLYGTPSPLASRKCIDHIDKHGAAFIALSPFLCLGTARKDGAGDVSPRGDAPGFVQVLDRKTIAIPDRPGNNRMDSFSNILDNPAVGLIFLIPGIEETLRVNGLARVSTDPALLGRMAVQGKTPKSALVVDVQEAMFHCAKALKRSKLWQEDYKQPRNALPSLARMISDQVGGGFDVPAAEQRLEENYKTGLY